MGEFKNDKYEGKGRKYSDDYFNKIKYEGDFKNGIYQRKIYDNSGYIIYEGNEFIFAFIYYYPKTLWFQGWIIYLVYGMKNLKLIRLKINLILKKNNL